MTPLGTSVTITIVQAPACHLCEDAESAVQRLAADYPITCQTLDIRSPEGLALIQTHRPAMNPLVLVDDQFFSAGRLPRGKLRNTLARRCDPAKVG